MASRTREGEIRNDGETNDRWPTFITSLVLSAAGVFLYNVKFPTSQSPDNAGPFLFPHLILIVWIGASFLVTILNLPRSTVPLGISRSNGLYVLRLIAIAALSCAFALLLPILGFATTAMLFFVPVAILCGERRLVLLTVSGVGFILAVWIMFTVLFGIPLPTSQIADWFA